MGSGVSLLPKKIPGNNILSSSLMSDLSASERWLWQSIVNGGGSIVMNNRCPLHATDGQLFQERMEIQV